MHKVGSWRVNKEHQRSLEEMYAAQRNASTSAQSDPSPTLPASPNDSSASASKDEPPEYKSKLGLNGPISHQAGRDIADYIGRLMFVNEETEFDGDDDLKEDNGGGSFFMETLVLQYLRRFRLLCPQMSTVKVSRIVTRKVRTPLHS